MDFIEVTKPEYKQMLKGLLWRDPFIRIWNPRFAIPVLVLVWIALAALGLEGGALIAVMAGFLGVFAVILTGLFVCLFVSFFRSLGYRRSNKKFVSKVNQLSEYQAEKLLSEYPRRRKIRMLYNRVYNNKKRKLLSSAIVYTTDNFLFIPGLFLICRDELDGVEIFDLPGSRVTGVGTFVDFTLKGEAPTQLPHPTLIPHPVRLPSTVRLPLDYIYRESPETAEQIMAWFWQCDPDSPGLSERTKKLMTEYYAGKPPKI